MADEDTERPRRPRWVSIARTAGGVVLGIGSAVLVARLMGLHLRGPRSARSAARVRCPCSPRSAGPSSCSRSRRSRWWWVVRPVLPLRYREAFSAMLVGSAFNVLIPARGGDLIRVQYLGKRTGTSRVTLLGTELLDYWSDKAGWLAGVRRHLRSQPRRLEAGAPDVARCTPSSVLALLVLGSAALVVIAHLPVLRRLSPRLDPGPRWLQKLRSGFAAHGLRGACWSWSLALRALCPGSGRCRSSWWPATRSTSRSPRWWPSRCSPPPISGRWCPVPGGAGSFEAAGAFALSTAACGTGTPSPSCCCTT